MTNTFDDDNTQKLSGTTIATILGIEDEDIPPPPPLVRQNAYYIFETSSDYHEAEEEQAIENPQPIGNAEEKGNNLK